MAAIDTNDLLARIYSYGVKIEESKFNKMLTWQCNDFTVLHQKKQDEGLYFTVLICPAADCSIAFYVPVVLTSTIQEQFTRLAYQLILCLLDENYLKIVKTEYQIYSKKTLQPYVGILKHFFISNSKIHYKVESNHHTIIFISIINDLEIKGPTPNL